MIKTGPKKLAIYQITITKGKVPEPLSIIFLLVLVSFLYTIFSMNMVFKYIRHLKNTQSNIDPSFHYWLIFLCVSLLIPKVTVLLITGVGNITVLATILNLALFVVIVYVTLTIKRLVINFLAFINKYRIEEAKVKLLDKDLNHYTIVTIAADSGFKSKTAFYSAFKKHVGSTPSQFRKENQYNTTI